MVTDEQLLRANLIRLHDDIAAVAPINSVSGEEGSVTIDFKPEATAQEQIDAQTVVDNFDWSITAARAWYDSLNSERTTLKNAAQAVSDLDTFLAISDPTANQIKMAVQKMALHQKHIIKRLIQID